MKRVRHYIPSGCATAGILHERGELIGGKVIMQAIAAMHERSNGLGGGFVGYGIYPEMKDYYALHVMYDREENLKIGDILSLPLEQKNKRRKS